MTAYLETHWIPWLEAGAGALVLYVALYFFGKPLVEFLGDRRDILIAANAHAFVSGYADQNRIKSAENEFRPLIAKMTYYSQGGPWVVRAYCLIRFYNLKLAAGTLRGLFQMIGSLTHSDETRRNNLDCLCWAQGADTELGSDRIEEIRKMLRESKDG